jgi:hypothetical protein
MAYLSCPEGVVTIVLMRGSFHPGEILTKAEDEAKWIK